MVIVNKFMISQLFLTADSCAPDGDSWKFYGDRCYFFSGIEPEPEAASWYSAQSWCNDNGGHLVSIHDEDMQAFIIGQVCLVVLFLFIGHYVLLS